MCRIQLTTSPDPLHRTTVAARLLVWCARFSAAFLLIAQAGADEVGIPWTGESGVTESVSDIMGREKNLPLQSVLQPAQSDEGRLLPNRKNLAAYWSSPRLSRSPAISPPAVATDAPLIT